MMQPKRDAPILAAVTLLVLLAACTGALQPTPSPGVSPTPTPTGVTPSPSPTITPAPTAQPTPTPLGVEVSSPAQAAALVLASDARFASVIPLHPELIGQCCWYEAVDAPGGYEVTIVIGWGDCPSGCIEEHRWRFHVDTEGTITPLGEEGSEPLPTPEPGQGPADVTVMLVAGPTCPVVTVPPDPSCAPRPVANAEVVIRDPQGNELHRGLSNEEGVLLMQVPPGAYIVEPQPVAGMMGTPVAAAFSVGAGGAAFLQFEYDTGIR